MSDMTAKSGVKKATISATVIRADGSREELGVVSEYNRDSWRERIKRWLRLS